MKLKTALLVALFALGAVGLVACGGDDDTTTDTAATQTTGGGGNGSGTTKATTTEEPAVATIVVRDGEPVGGVQELEFDAGDQIRFRVKSDEADEVHVHGYDVEEEVAAGGTASFSFPADIEGIFEVELHGSETQIAELRVNP